jgi:hypothetical protein
MRTASEEDGPPMRTASEVEPDGEAVPAGRRRPWRWLVAGTAVTLFALMGAAVVFIDGPGSGGEADQVLPPGPAPAPVTGGPMPGPGSTGVAAGVTLRPSGSIVVDTDGAVIENREVDGQIDVKANRVTIRNCRIKGGPNWGIRIYEGTSGTRVTDTEIAPPAPSSDMDGIAAEAGFTGTRLDISGTSDGIKATSGTRLEASWVHDLANGPQDHADAVQILGGTGITLDGNLLEGASNAAVMASSEYTPVSDLTLTRNWFRGGAWTLNIRGGAHGKPAGVVVNGNSFDRKAVYGPAAIEGTFTQSGNHWDDGTAVKL